MKKYVMVLLALVMVFSCCTVYADEDDEYEYEDDTYYSEETDENEWDDEENEEYEETYEYDDEDDTEEWEEEDEDGDNEDWEYSEESYEEPYEETVSEVSEEESSEPVLKRDPLAFQQETDVLLPIYAEISESISESSTEKAVPESSAEEKVLNIADLAKPESKSTAFSVWGSILWIMIGMMTVGAVVILANTKTQGAFRRRRYYRAAKRMTKKHIG